MTEVTGNNWGASPKSLLNLYAAHVMSKPLYVAPLLCTRHQATLSSSEYTSARRPSYTPNLSGLAETLTIDSERKDGH